MATIGSLAIKLFAKTASFRKSMGKAGKSIRSVGKAAKTAGRLVKGLLPVFGKLSAIAGLVGFAGLGVMVKATLANVDALAKFSDRSGIATETLAGFAHAATLAGASGEILNKGLDRLARNIFDASQGLGEAQLGFETLGLSAQDLIDMPLDQAFLAIADKMGTLAVGTERTAVAMQLFGRAGAGLVNVLQGGSKPFQDAIDFVTKVGTGISRLDAGKLEAVNDAIADLKEIFAGVATTITLELSPVFFSLVEHIKDISTEGRGLRGVIEDWVRAGIVGVAKFIDSFGELRIQFIEFQQFMNNLGAAIPGVGEGFGALFSPSDRFIELQKKKIDIQNELAAGGKARTAVSALDDAIARIDREAKKRADPSSVSSAPDGRTPQERAHNKRIASEQRRADEKRDRLLVRIAAKLAQGNRVVNIG